MINDYYISYPQIGMLIKISGPSMGIGNFFR